MIETKLIETTVHGRFLVRIGPPENLLVSFHGYAETADANLAAIDPTPGLDAWTLCAVQALHPFYVRGGQEVVASWMTRLDREEAIRDNIEYVRRVIATFPRAEKLVFAGFSQGAAMAARAGAAIPSAGLILLGGDIPPDVIESEAALPRTLLGRGVRDDWYTAEKLKNDLRFLGPSATAVEFDGGHEWTDEFRRAVNDFLTRV